MTSGESSSGGSSSTGHEPPEVIELEGWIEITALATILHACDSSWYAVGGDTQDLWLCDGSYAHVRGTVLDCPGTCSMEVLMIEEVFEARLCDPSDCGGMECAPLDCANECDQHGECPPGSKCVPWAPPDVPYAGLRCVEVAADPVGAGEACSEDATMPWIDDCDATSMCTGVDPTTSTGTCTTICYDNECGADETCFVANEFEFRACFPSCNPLDDTCAAGSVCTVGFGFACIDLDELPLLVEWPCEDGVTCGDDSYCADARWVPGCAHDTCCTPLCDMLAPDCPAGTPCTAWYEDPPPGQENVGVCIAV